MSSAFGIEVYDLLRIVCKKVTLWTPNKKEKVSFEGKDVDQVYRMCDEYYGILEYIWYDDISFEKEVNRIYSNDSYNYLVNMDFYFKEYPEIKIGYAETDNLLIYLAQTYYCKTVSPKDLEGFVKLRKDLIQQNRLDGSETIGLYLNR